MTPSHYTIAIVRSPQRDTACALSSPVVGVEAGGLYGGVVAALPVAPDPVEGHARVRLHGAEPDGRERGK